MKRKTTIILAIIGVLALTRTFYGATAFPYALNFGGTGPIGIAASASDAWASEYCSPNIDIIDCNGNISFFAAIPSDGCNEKYMAVAPSQAALAGFTPRDLFVTFNGSVTRISGNPPVVTPNFVTLAGCEGDMGITFDHYGPTGSTPGFNYNMIVTCENGPVWQVAEDPITHLGNPTLIANTGVDPQEGPAIPSPFFGPFGGQILIADENHSSVNAIDSLGNVTLNAFKFYEGYGPEGIDAVPEALCTHCSGGALFASIYNFNAIIYYRPIDFLGLGGNSIITLSEFGGPIFLIHWDGTQYVQTTFDSLSGTQFEGSNFADCDVPTPTPTPTPTNTPTSTPTSTPTNTPTNTPTSTPTNTPTNTPTSTPTNTPTSTPTSTPTATPTPTFTPCGALGSCTPPYPFTSSNPRTSIAFNESEVLAAFRVTTTADGCTPLTLNMFYSDEHALTLGVRQTQTKTCAGITVDTVCTVSPMTMHPADHVKNPMTGCTEAQGGVDPSGRPMAPEVFITDLDTYPGNSNPLAGDWQFGGTGKPPDDVFGTWKAAVSTFDTTVSPNVITVTPDADPASNGWNLDGLPPCPGPNCPDPVPTPTPANQGYGAEVRWNISSLGLTPGHHYRLYFIVHDGDQNKTGGDSGQACVFLTMPGSSPPPSPTPTASPTATPTATPFALPAGIIVGTETLSGKTIKVSFFNNTGTPQTLTALHMSWPQGTNGNLTKITMGGTTIYSTPTASPLNTSSLLGTDAQRTIAAGACATLTFSFVNNVDTNPADYTGSAHFNPFGDVQFFPSP
jgi:hypothetical protein